MTQSFLGNLMVNLHLDQLGSDGSPDGFEMLIHRPGLIPADGFLVGQEKAFDITDIGLLRKWNDMPKDISVCSEFLGNTMTRSRYYNSWQTIGKM